MSQVQPTKNKKNKFSHHLCFISKNQETWQTWPALEHFASRAAALFQVGWDMPGLTAPTTP